MSTKSAIFPAPSESESRIGFLGVFTSPEVEAEYRRRHHRDDQWLVCFLVAAAMLRVSLLFFADYQHFGPGLAFWLLLACRVAFVVVSACVLLALGRASTPATADRLFFVWALLLAGLTVYSLSARSPDNTRLLFMSFGVVLVGYCVTPLPLPSQAILALSYSAAALCACRRADGADLWLVGLAHVMSNIFGAVTSWKLNHQRRKAFLGAMREAELRAGLEEASAEIRTLRGLVCICAWCKRVRDEAEAWQPVEAYVQSRTHAAFTHGICPGCLQSRAWEIAQVVR